MSYVDDPSVAEKQYIIHNKYVILAKIGKGKFGEVYKGRDIHTNETVAIKLEHHNISMPTPRPVSKYANKPDSLNILKHETQLLNYLHNRRCRNIPYIYWYGIQSNIPALVMPFYEYSLFDLFTQTIQNSSTKYKQSNNMLTSGSGAGWTPEETMQRIIRILQHIHESGVVHRDIKPHNFMVKNRELVLIDFGMATFYVDERMKHIKEPEQLKEHLLGTPKYISINLHYGKEYTRRDDLISAGYLYLFLRNWLFWDRTYSPTTFEDTPSPGIPRPPVASRPEFFAQSTETHISHPKNYCLKSSKELSNIEKCLGEITKDTTPRVARNILEYLRYVYAIEFGETPNYEIMIRHFSNNPAVV